MLVFPAERWVARVAVPWCAPTGVIFAEHSLHPSLLGVLLRYPLAALQELRLKHILQSYFFQTEDSPWELSAQMELILFYKKRGGFHYLLKTRNLFVPVKLLLSEQSNNTNKNWANPQLVNCYILPNSK